MTSPARFYGASDPGRLYAQAMALRAEVIRDGGDWRDYRIHVARHLWAAADALRTRDAKRLEKPYDVESWSLAKKGIDAARELTNWVEANLGPLRSALDASTAAAPQDAKAADDAVLSAARELAFWAPLPLFPLHLRPAPGSDDGEVVAKSGDEIVRVTRRPKWSAVDVAKALARVWTGDEVAVTSMWRSV